MIGQGFCPYCGGKNRHRVSSVGTVQKCGHCGKKYNVTLEEEDFPSTSEVEPGCAYRRHQKSGVSCASVFLAIIVLCFCACCLGGILVKSDLPTKKLKKI